MADIFNPAILKALSGDAAVGHVRYSTTGSSLLKNAQPFLAQRRGSFMAVAHNGNLVNARELKDQPRSPGVDLPVHHGQRDLRPPDRPFEERRLPGKDHSGPLPGPRGLFHRPPHGKRPDRRQGPSRVPASLPGEAERKLRRWLRRPAPSIWSRPSTCDDIQPGEVVLIDKDGLHSEQPFPKVKPSFCIFEYIYFARPDSNIFGENVYLVRKKLGARLAEESPADVDLVMPIPDSGNYAALGFARAAGPSLRDGDDSQSLRGADVHPAFPERAGFRG